MDVQAHILGRLASALDRTPEVKLAGMHLMIGEEGYGPDKQGRLWLHADASPALWSQYAHTYICPALHLPYLAPVMPSICNALHLPCLASAMVCLFVCLSLPHSTNKDTTT